jgi:hypothetical protein
MFIYVFFFLGFDPTAVRRWPMPGAVPESLPVCLSAGTTGQHDMGVLFVILGIKLFRLLI